MKTFIGGKLITLLALAALVGCGNTNEAVDDRNRMMNELDPTGGTEQQQMDNELNDRLGYVRYTKEENDLDADRNREVTIDRTEMANMITRIILDSDGFDEVATLVTDEEVLIAYLKNDEFEQVEAADIAKKTAMSVLPRYFDIYVSDNEVLIDDIHSLHNSTTTNQNYDNTINRIIDEMKQSPQGYNNKQNDME
ncbi:YhcN/YlaJ family sporulation lipoprotein [Virgibacillus sp. C22-A2]|uniref:YhcN/YlaJ family sporulation lipoprotein n=1 Tax=Virgibacillus tibetensis TaxID=3042313 RepID=A0ABU6KKM1_9BACI|nr:YhcN/YlaJ family sporulation lipoprotein [Virgibacillus sp. C22-A2]